MGPASYLPTATSGCYVSADYATDMVESYEMPSSVLPEVWQSGSLGGGRVLRTTHLDNHRFILLNRLISISKSRARLHSPPTHAATELLEIIDNRRSRSLAIEFEGLTESRDSVDEKLRLTQGVGYNFLRLTQMKWEGDAQSTRYVTLLFEHVDQAQRSFPVVNTTTYRGREIEGEEEERGATAIHVVIQMPPESALNLGKYRCAIEVVSPITADRNRTFFLATNSSEDCRRRRMDLSRNRSPSQKTTGNERIQIYASFTVGRRRW